MSTRLSALFKSIDTMLAARTSVQWRNSRSMFARAARKLKAADVDRLVGMLPIGGDDEPRTASFKRSRMMQALAYHQDRKRTIPSLRFLLRRDSRLTRTFAATALGKIGPDASPAAKVLSSLMDGSRCPTLIHSAHQAFSRIKPDMAEAKAKSMSWYWRAEYAVPNWCAVYSAEEWLKPMTFGVKYKTLEEVDCWLRTVFDDSWFRRRFREACDLYSFALHDGRGSRCATGDYKYGFCHLTLPRFARNQLIVLHELSHALAIASGNHDGHKRGFCRIYLSLVGHFLGHAASADLRLNLKTFDHDGACL